MKAQYFENIHIINILQRMVDEVGRQNYIYVINRISILSSKLSRAFSVILEHKAYMEEGGLTISEPYIMGMLSDLLLAQEREDYILYVDLLSLQVYPFFVDVQNAIRAQEGFFYDRDLWDRNMEKLKDKDKTLFTALQNADELHKQSVYRDCAYQVEPTTTGAFTLAICEQGTTYYLHSNENPYREALRFAEAYFDVQVEQYLGFGLGLGYHWQALVEKNPDIILDIIEPDIGVLHQAFTYMDMEWYLEHDNIRIYYDANYAVLDKKITQNMGVQFVPLRAYVRHIREDNVRGILQDCLLRENSIRQYRISFVINSKSNFACCDAYVDVLEPVFHGRRVVLIAGGPSLDGNVMALREKPENTIYVAVGTVFRKLLMLGITPDYVVFSDPKNVVYGQIKGLEQEQVPVLLLSTAYKNIGQNYIGKKYLVCQQEYDVAEQYAQAHGYRTYQVGGSVLTLALDVSIQLGASEIICVGLDLAFTGNKDHASDTHQDKKIQTDATIRIAAVGGGWVMTNRPFDLCRRWIEKRLTMEDVRMPVYDATEGGAVIAGMQQVTLKEVL